MTPKLSKLLRIAGLVLTVTLVLTIAPAALSNSPSQQPPPPAEIRVGAEDHGRQIELKQGQVLVVGLPCNPSTGYLWEVEEAEVGTESAGILRQTQEPEFQPASRMTALEAPESGSVLLGAPATQLLRFEAVDAGQTALELVYRRPWEEHVAPAKAFSLQVQVVGPFSRADAATTTSPLESSPKSPIASSGDPALGLPAAFNWCAQGGCTPVKNQGNCGSCWAFSTVGPLESNILLQDGETKDLSEQYLVSCNTDGWDCDGGWFAHDYHEDRKLPGEPEAGAVYEDDFPYVAPPVPSCSSPYPHHEKILSWEYVGDSRSVPLVADIKQAILDHGPVSAAVCATPSWGGYDSGVFDTDQTQWCIDNHNGQSVNHAIVLVGWDDNQGTNGVWILRNSWGPDWGENGYMNIEYGVSSVGYAANYVVYDSGCYDLDTSAHPSGVGTVTADRPPDCGLDDYQPGTEVELTANAASGWDFVSWSGDASGSSNPFTVTMDSDQSIGAHFMCDGCAPSGFVPLVVKE